MRRISQLGFLLLFFQTHLYFAQVDPKISSVINQVNIDSLYENLKELTGDKPVKIPNGNVFIYSRANADIGNVYAEEYLQDRFKKYGLTTSLQRFDGGGANIIGIQKGVIKPNQQIIICAHFDDRPYQSFAPGADDNGSGTSAVLEAARILSKYKTDYTIIYALWDNEEIGLLGSGYYARQASSRNDSIIAVINMDMIGWDGNNDNLAEIHTKSISNSNLIAGNLLRINFDYDIGLKFALIEPGSTSSDHSSFWNYNYSAVLLIEGYFSQDFNPRYHTTFDNISFINKPYFEKCAKTAIGTLAYYAKIQTLTSVKPNMPLVYELFQNYPNPFNPSTIIKYNIEKEAHVKLIVYDVLGKEIERIVDQVQKPNAYEVKFDAKKWFPSGVYFYVLNTNEYSSVRKMILVK
ncbi:MAG: M28 family peptidase [Ignavibacteriales bacterium]|nr:M28 family peptidase [Ignavibacteriales bacterium]